MSGLWHASSSKYLSSCKARKSSRSAAGISAPIMMTSSASADQINTSLMTMMIRERRSKAPLSSPSVDMYDDDDYKSLGIPLQVIKVYPSWRPCNTQQQG
eukprot:TRINITY_DN14850_c0_g1_i2.p1 TRINITY_DN14850_c0_g1~~TRINITY_DN14850_c0_g1_i2.p1  ORF type:complete len:100 (-),score=27.44 TRINITY_DN14850_c0_g1_i2:102-401(-)